MSVEKSTRRWLVAIALGAMMASPAVAFAQDEGVPGFELRSWNLNSSQRYGYLTGESGATLPEGRFELGLMGTYLMNPLNLYDGEGERVVTVISDIVVADVYVTYTPIERLQLSLNAPFYLLQSADNEERLPGATRGSLDGGGIGGLRFTPKVMLVPRTLGEPGFALSLQAALVFPTGSEQRLQGENSVRFMPAVAADFDTGTIAVGGTLGFTVRENVAIANLDIRDVFNYALSFKADLVQDSFQFLAELRGGLSIGSDDSGGVAATLDEETPFEFDAALRYLNDDIVLTVGGGSGLNVAYNTPDLRTFLGITWAPIAEEVCDEDYDGYQDEDCVPDPDNDSDAILDVDDACPGVDADTANDFIDVAEDYDNFEDSDGCPEPDNDRDRILDVVDECPGADPDAMDDPPFVQVAEDYDDFEDTDGCPEIDNDYDTIPDYPVRVDECPGTDETAARNINTQETFNNIDDEDGCPDDVPSLPPDFGWVYFDFDVGEEVQNQSIPELDNLATLLRQYPEVRLLRIEGHTDNRGTDAYNLRLSCERASTAYQELIRRGVEPERLRDPMAEPRTCYGESRPINPGLPAIGPNEDGYDPQYEPRHQENRRVEFHIEDWGGGTFEIRETP
jgi:outer membrane protein OmpA-like peptidoglycan-associated protein